MITAQKARQLTKAAINEFIDGLSPAIEAAIADRQFAVTIPVPVWATADATSQLTSAGFTVTPVLGDGAQASVTVALKVTW